jgi:hypothetical protein
VQRAAEIAAQIEQGQNARSQPCRATHHVHVASPTLIRTNHGTSECSRANEHAHPRLSRLGS